MTLGNIREILRQAKDSNTVEEIYFEGGEPFLFYPVLLTAVREARTMGFRVGIVSNAYWATTADDAFEWLRPFTGLLEDLSVSSDLYHSDRPQSSQAGAVRAAARQLGIPCGTIGIAQPESAGVDETQSQLPTDDSPVMYRGRAAEKLAGQAPQRPWAEFSRCEHEDLRDPGRLHVDPLGYLHICQGIAVGNVFETPLTEIRRDFQPESHPVLGPLIEGGPAELVRRYELEPELEGRYADACHLCYEARRALRGRFPEIFTPDAMYGVPT